MSGPDNDNPQWHQNQEPHGEGQAPQWNAEGQGQPPPWDAGGQAPQSPWDTGGQAPPPQWTGAQQGWRPPGAPPPPVQIKNYRTQAIIAVILSVSCWFGLAAAIPALINSSRVTENVGRGDYARAVDSSRKARLLSWISIGIVAFFWVIIAIVIAVSSSHNPVPSINTGTTTTGTTNTGNATTGTTNTGNTTTGNTTTGNTGTANTGNTTTGNTGTANTGNTGN